MISRQNLIRLTRELVDIPSVTGAESEAVEFLFEQLAVDGWSCSRQPVSQDRYNLLAVRQPPRILLTTHLDTVPPYFASREDEDYVYGRGSCDAKGVAAAMVCAASELSASGRSDIGLLFVVGEETESDGALKAAESTAPVAFLIDGEPTDNELVTGHKGIVLARLHASGIAAHSAYPERGESAIDKLIAVLQDLKALRFPADPLLGQAHVNIGLLGGGVAINVIAPSAQADILIRSVGPSAEYITTLEKICGDRCRLHVIKATEPQRMLAVDGFPQKVVGYGTDIPALRPLGQPLLLGPGSIFEAHTDNEKIAKVELNRAVDLYQTLVRKLDQWVDQKPRASA